MTIAEKLTTIAENEQKVFNAGKQAEYDRFWDLFQDYGNRDHYQYAFSYFNFDDDSYNPKYPIKATRSVYSGYYMFAECKGITDTKVDIEFYYNANYAFNNAKELKTIRKMIVRSNVTYASTFVGATALESVTFDGVIGNNITFVDCEKLSKESITNIIEHLSSEASGKNLTFSQVAKEAAFTEDEWNALIATKPNWTFNLA